MKKIAVLIPAAGYSSRMGLYKPLLPIDSSLIIEKTISVMLAAGIKDIRVIVGHKADLLIPLLNRLGVNVIINPHYEQGMYSSIKEGVLSLEKDNEAFFLLPGDYPFVKPETVKQLLKAYHLRPCETLYPVYNGLKGHPPLISTKLRDVIVAENPSGGLRELLEDKVQDVVELPVDDEGILIDLDFESDYQHVLRDSLAPYPSRDECRKILEKHQTNPRVLAHMQAVANIAGLVTEHLNSRGFKLHSGLVTAASLLHDIAKGNSNHARIGGEIVEKLGYPEVAAIISSHMELGSKCHKKINETTIVYLADKLVSGTELVNLEDRLYQQLDDHQDEDIRSNIKKRLGQAIHIQKRIESILQLRLNEIFLNARRVS